MTKKNSATTSNEQEEAKIKEEAVKKINSIGIIASWVGFTPDCRPYKPSSPEIVFYNNGLDVVVNVPLTNDLIVNANTISIQQLSNQKEDKPLFTPLGMRYIIDQFETAMSNSKVEAEEPPSDNDDWGEDSPEDKAFEVEDEAKRKPATSDDEWDDEEPAKKSNKEDEESFDEDWS